ncbi:MAG: septum formation initiator family protein [Candidatus Pristimantibacillus lignocellulolyticus]|uniref:Septum formation initiator family protein n=1 Tax=Candidatus Pristimantibacillus lignocellulolyticus TaxID=2994561 RepID=A0A9J6ZIM9_9BACL|nr:MAG: septum formation initiator family protein [Candidatus Pristimantibacillus lignocellulolyticus]
MAQTKSKQSISGAKRRFKILFVLAAIFLAWAGYTLLNQSNQQDAMQEKLMSLESNRDSITKERDSLATQIKLLNDPEYMSQLATKEQGMVKEGEQQIFSEQP